MPTRDDSTLLSGQPAKTERAEAETVVPISETTRSTSTPEVRVKLMRSSRPPRPGFGETDRFVEREVIGGGGMGLVIRRLPEPRSAGEAEDAASSDPQGALIGTPSYMAHEQLRGDNDKVDERTDVFALGATLYQILTGQPPRLPHSVHALVRSRTPVPITAPEEVVKDGVVPGELSRIAMKAMSSEAADRYVSADEFKGDVERFLRGTWHLPRIRFAAGSVIVSQGDAGESAYIITEGQCYAYRSDDTGESVLREMGPGDVFGETAVLSQKPRTASVKASTDVELMVVTSDILSSALGLNRWMGAFVRALTERFREVDERLRQIERPRRRRGPR